VSEKTLIVFTFFATKKEKQTNILQIQNETCLVVKPSRTSAHNRFLDSCYCCTLANTNSVNEGTLWAAALQAAKLRILLPLRSDL